MFSLIITIIAVALVAALALATIYFGGDFVRDGHSRAQSARYLQEGNQVVGALELYRIDHGEFPAGTAEAMKTELVAQNYLQTWPSATWGLTTDYAIRADVTYEACVALNTKLKIANPQVVPSCTDTQYSNQSICCTSA